MAGAYKSVTCTGTVSSVSDAYSALEELKDECQEVVDNATDGLKETSRIQTFEETAGTLEGLQEPDVPECVQELSITYDELVNRRKRASPSRSTRCSNAVAVLQAGESALDAWLEDPANEEHDDRGEVESLRDQLSSDASEAEQCEFPGMYG